VVTTDVLIDAPSRPKPPPIGSHEYLNYSRKWKTVSVWGGRATGTWYVNDGTIYVGSFPRDEHAAAVAKAFEVARGR
jgi:hypothetical protein